MNAFRNLILKTNMEECGWSSKKSQRVLWSWNCDLKILLRQRFWSANEFRTSWNNLRNVLNCTNFGLRSDKTRGGKRRRESERGIREERFLTSSSDSGGSGSDSECRNVKHWARGNCAVKFSSTARGKMSYSIKDLTKSHQRLKIRQCKNRAGNHKYY